MLRVNNLTGFGGGGVELNHLRPPLLVNTNTFYTPSFNDPDWASVVFLSGYPGANGSTTVTDESVAAHGTGTISGSGTVITSQSKFDGSSFGFDGGTVIRWADSNDWNFAAGNFTVDTFIRPTSSSFSFVIAQWPSAAGQLAWVLSFDTAFYVNVSTTGSDNIGILGGGTVTLNTWQHVRFDYDGSAYRLYKDGTMVNKNTTPRTIFNSTAQLALGGNSDAAAFKMLGQLDETRITKGVARCGSDSGFVVPDAAYPRS